MEEPSSPWSGSFFSPLIRERTMYLSSPFLVIEQRKGPPHGMAPLCCGAAIHPFLSPELQIGRIAFGHTFSPPSIASCIFKSGTFFPPFSPPFYGAAERDLVLQTKASSLSFLRLPFHFKVGRLPTFSFFFVVEISSPPTTSLFLLFPSRRLMC